VGKRRARATNIWKPWPDGPDECLRGAQCSAGWFPRRRPADAAEFYRNAVEIEPFGWKIDYHWGSRCLS